MSKYYVLEASKNVSDFISVKEGVSTFSKACQMSEFQLIDSVPVIIEVDPDSGKIFQDFIYDKGVPLISDKMKDCFDDCNVDYLFYKKVILTKKQLGIEQSLRIFKNYLKDELSRVILITYQKIKNISLYS